MKMRTMFVPILACLLVASLTVAQERAAEKNDDSKNTKQAKEEELKDKVSVTQHTATIQDREIKYTATAGKLVMKSYEGDPKALMFFIAYTKDGVDDVGKRPITFAFNGGPGSSSVWLHLGMLGPKRVKIPDDASAVPPPYGLQSNPYSILDLTDLVFIDPVSTGFSRPVEGEDKGQFHGYEQDLQSVGHFIHDYVTKYGRWRSAKFLAGESYGGLRSAGLSGHLRQRYNMALNGIVMISPAINFLTLGFSPGNDLPYILFVPSYAATAWYHKVLPGDLQQMPLEDLVQEADEFARNEYTLALMKGHSLSDEDRNAVAEKLARYTGLSKEFVERANLRIDMQRFGKELLRERGRTIGRYDSRFSGIDADSVGERPEYDPSGAIVFGPFTAAINDHLRNDLKFEDDQVYEILTGNVQPWSYGRFGGRAPDASDTLRETMSANPFLKLFLACGYYDLATPPATVIYSVEHMRLPKELQKNITAQYYEGGHMMYIHEASIKKLRKDLEEFYETALETVEEEKEEALEEENEEPEV
jgi:carboxypeptidase C (cathepsin A)